MPQSGFYDSNTKDFKFSPEDWLPPSFLDTSPRAIDEIQRYSYLWRDLIESKNLENIGSLKPWEPTCSLTSTERRRNDALESSTKCQCRRLVYLASWGNVQDVQGSFEDIPCVTGTPTSANASFSRSAGLRLPTLGGFGSRYPCYQRTMATPDPIFGTGIQQAHINRDIDLDLAYEINASMGLIRARTATEPCSNMIGPAEDWLSATCTGEPSTVISEPMSRLAYINLQPSGLCNIPGATVSESTAAEGQSCCKGRSLERSVRELDRLGQELQRNARQQLSQVTADFDS